VNDPNGTWSSTPPKAQSDATDPQKLAGQH